MEDDAVAAEQGKLVRVPELITEDRLGMTVLLVLAEGCLLYGSVRVGVAGAFAASSSPGPVLDLALVVLISTLIVWYLARQWVQGSQAGMVLRSDGIVVVHPKSRYLDLGRGSRLVPWAAISDVKLIAMGTAGGPFGEGVPRWFLALELVDGTQVCTFGLAVGHADHRHLLIRAHQTIDIARRRHA